MVVTVNFSEQSELSTPRYSGATIGVPSSYFLHFFPLAARNMYVTIRLGVYKQVEPVS